LIIASPSYEAISPLVAVLFYGSFPFCAPKSSRISLSLGQVPALSPTFQQISSRANHFSYPHADYGDVILRGFSTSSLGTICKSHPPSGILLPPPPPSQDCQDMANSTASSRPVREPQTIQMPSVLKCFVLPLTPTSSSR